jgi:hypothetical protein
MKKQIIFAAAIIIVAAYVIGFAFNNPAYIGDGIFSCLAIGAFFLLEKKYPLKPWLIVLGIIPFMLELTGLTFGFFAFSLFGFGYDKMLHFANSLMLTILLYFWISTGHKKNTGIKIFIAMFVMLGFGLLGEISEFLGQRYFHIYSPGMFSQGDLLPSTLKNDLINYDTWWDMIMDLAGAIFAGIILAVRKKR